MDIDALTRLLQATSFATAIREGDLLFPWLEAVHVLAISLVVGTIAIVDLRLLGWASRDRAFDRLAAEVLPFTWAAFAIAVLTGSLLFSAKAHDYIHNPYFQFKFVFMAMAGINMAIFHLLGNRDIAQWSASPAAVPLRGRMAGAASLLLWIAVIGCGRWIGFTMHPSPLGG